MNAPRSDELIYPEAAGIVPGGHCSRSMVDKARNASLNLLGSGSIRCLPEKGHIGLEFENPLGDIVPVDSTWSSKPRKNHPRHSETDRCSSRSSHSGGGTVDRCDLSLESIARGILEPVSTSIQRITSQAGTGWGDRPTHEHLAVTEKNWRLPPSDRHHRESAATTTVGTALPGNSSAVGDS